MKLSKKEIKQVAKEHAADCFGVSEFLVKRR